MSRAYRRAGRAVTVMTWRAGPKVRDVKAALESGDVEERADGVLIAAGELLHPEEVIRGDADLLQHAEWIRREVLANELVIDDAVSEPLISER